MGHRRGSTGRVAGAVICIVLLWAGAMVGVAAAQNAVSTAKPAAIKWGYITMPDGAKLRYTVWLPAGKGPFPTLMNYDGYQAGTQPDRSIPEFAGAALAKGYAVAGVSLRGSACSDGTWELFNEQQGRDGATALDWLAGQDWSNGKVATFSYSYGGIMQLWLAAARPKHLVAIGPGNVIYDTYRDIGFPGGILNAVFPPAWGAILNGDWKNAEQNALQQGDSYCTGNTARHAVNNNANTLFTEIVQHPFDDEWHHDHSMVNFADRIEVPALGIQAWQDEETGPRGGQIFNLLDPKKTWLVASNGFHELLTVSKPLIEYELKFYDHFLKGDDNGFEKTPHVQIWNETTVADWSPRTITQVDRLPVRVQETDIPLGPKGLQSDKGAEKSSYAYPVPSPTSVDTAGGTVYQPVQSSTWTVSPDVPTGRAAFTTPPLTDTVTTYGPASADLWVSTTAKDVDLQATIVEVRPDGQEMYVQRGWLRASQRALDPKRSTALTPFHPHTKASAQDMPAGTPELLRVDVFPFSHTFRKGSSIRMYVEMPSTTGLWGFTTVPTPQTVTVYHDAAHPSKLALGLLPRTNVKDARAACGAVHSQPCRPNPVAVPSGTLDVRPARGSDAAAPKVSARFVGAGTSRKRVTVRLRATGASLKRVRVELRRDGRTIARSTLRTLGTSPRTVTLTRRGRQRFAPHRYTLVVKAGATVLLRSTLVIPRASRQ